MRQPTLIKLKTALFFLLSSAVMTSMNVYATAPGFYMGGMAGPATNNGSTQNVTGTNGVVYSVKPNKNQFAVRLYMGYQANNYFAVETGPTYISTVGYDTSNTTIDGSVNVGVVDWDIVGKASLPISTIDLYVKGGAAILYEGASRALVGATGTKYRTTARPTVSLGAGYDLSQNWVADLSINRIMTGSYLNSVDYIALGISYHFVDKYCGQFLCDD